MFNAYMKTRSLQLKPYFLCSDNRQRVQSLGTRVVILAATEQTGSAFNLFDVLCPVGFATPLHIHYTEDVAVYVLEGALTFFWGGEKKKAEAGSYFFQPRGTPHGFRVEGETPARILYMTIPAGFDRFVIEHKQPNPKSETETDAARYKVEILGPLPEQMNKAS
jgi:quercetin dioxygenase-like cupin family protein